MDVLRMLLYCTRHDLKPIGAVHRRFTSSETTREVVIDSRIDFYKAVHNVIIIYPSRIFQQPLTPTEEHIIVGIIIEISLGSRRARLFFFIGNRSISLFVTFVLSHNNNYTTRRKYVPGYNIIYTVYLRKFLLRKEISFIVFSVNLIQKTPCRHN